MRQKSSMFQYGLLQRLIELLNHYKSTAMIKHQQNAIISFSQ